MYRGTMLGSRPGLSLLAAVAVVWAMGASGAPAAAIHTETASSGAWHASFTYVARPGSATEPYSGLRLVVTHRGSLVFDAPVVSRLGGTPVGPGGLEGHSSVAFADLNGADPEAVLTLFTGGAHCCFIDQVYDFDHATPRKVLGSTPAPRRALGGRRHAAGSGRRHRPRLTGRRTSAALSSTVTSNGSHTR
jgi:hypothetical protein